MNLNKSEISLKKKAIISTILVLTLLYFIVPLPRFSEPLSTSIYSENGKLLGAKIADDEQWRFPVIDSVPYKFETSLTLFEDKWFRYHPGVNPVSIVRAFIQNTKALKIKSGGSTITMQTIRMARKKKERSIKQKIIELYFATRLEIKHSKSEILRMYASNAPFGGNVVGLEAASWRYYARPPHRLSWAESATLAVLPNAPSLIYPGKNQKLLLEKRNRLLKKLLNNGYIDSLTYSISLKENIPTKPGNLPQLAPHLLQQNVKNNKGKRTTTTINFYKQKEARNILNNYSKQLSRNEIHNAAAIIVENSTGNVIAYLGNSDYSKQHGNSVDVIHAPRSTGSILKPILYAAMINDGEILQNTLIPDIPIHYEGFSPENFHQNFDGAVPAYKALARSLNVPSVKMLAKYRVDRFYNLLQSLSFSTINKAPGNYGLTLILGGAEANLWDLTRVYSGMAKTLHSTVNNEYMYSLDNYRELNYIKGIKQEEEYSEENAQFFSAASIWLTFKALQEVNRPDNQAGWESFSSSKKIAWKTGTSYGFRDAWAIGVSPEYTVGVWIGNADGEGRPGITGVSAAAPLMFKLFELVNSNSREVNWFPEPFDEFTEAEICEESGHLASQHCPDVITESIVENGLRTEACPYHKTLNLDSTGFYRVNSKCESAENIIQKKWFILPPAMAYYYKKHNAFYRSIPPVKKGCLAENIEVMEFIYPKNISKIFLPRNLNGERGKTIFEVAHRSDDIELFWHIDDNFIKSTKNNHQVSLSPSEGWHTVTVVDDNGNSISYRFEVVQ